MEVTEVKPNGAASIIETDCNVDFDEPVGYVAPKVAAHGAMATAGVAGTSDGSGAESESNVGTAFPARVVQRARAVGNEETAASEGVFTAFGGNAQRIDGKVKPAGAGAAAASPVDAREAAIKAAQARADAAAAAAASSTEGGAVPGHKSRIGAKFSTKKANASAFSGSGSKLG